MKQGTESSSKLGEKRSRSLAKLAEKVKEAEKEGKGKARARRR